MLAVFQDHRPLCGWLNVCLLDDGTVQQSVIPGLHAQQRQPLTSFMRCYFLALSRQPLPPPNMQQLRRHHLYLLFYAKTNSPGRRTAFVNSCRVDTEPSDRTMAPHHRLALHQWTGQERSKDGFAASIDCRNGRRRIRLYRSVCESTISFTLLSCGMSN